jgi:manganese transport protein
MTILPKVQKRKRQDNVRMHKDAAVLQQFAIPKRECIAVALEFTKNDEKLIAHALSQGNHVTKFYLVHIVESASARMLGEASDDYETRKDQQHLDSYIDQLKAQGYSVDGQLGYKNRITEIVRLVEHANADLLVLGAHRHTGIFDYLYGETVERVRHKLKIPVLIVS